MSSSRAGEHQQPLSQNNPSCHTRSLCSCLLRPSIPQTLVYAGLFLLYRSQIGQRACQPGLTAWLTRGYADRECIQPACTDPCLKSRLGAAASKPPQNPAVALHAAAFVLQEGSSQYTINALPAEPAQSCCCLQHTLQPAALTQPMICLYCVPAVPAHQEMAMPSLSPTMTQVGTPQEAPSSSVCNTRPPSSD